MHRRLIEGGLCLAACLVAPALVPATDGWPRHHGGGYGWQGISPGFRGSGIGLGQWGGAGWGGGLWVGSYGGYFGYPPYGTYYLPSANYVEYYLPPYYEPAELYYGPQALKQFLGLDRNFALGPLREPPPRLPLLPAPAAGGAARAAAAGDDAAPARPAVRVASPAMRLKAERYLAEGDALFLEQRFHSALQKYKLASKAAPDMAESHWRRGHGLVATGNFDLAAAAFKRALLFDADPHRGGFRLDELYGPAAMAKTVHLERLAEHALEHEHSADAYFLLGVFLAYDGQRERADKFFARALDLSGAGGWHVAAFLDAAAPPARPRPALAAPAAAEPAKPRALAIGPGTEI
jgi:tetratricopeptide (TPR) repeat protein